MRFSFPLAQGQNIASKCLSQTSCLKPLEFGGSLPFGQEGVMNRSDLHCFCCCAMIWGECHSPFSLRKKYQEIYLPWKVTSPDFFPRANEKWWIFETCKTNKKSPQKTMVGISDVFPQLKNVVPLIMFTFVISRWGIHFVTQPWSQTSIQIHPQSLTVRLWKEAVSQKGSSWNHQVFFWG